MLKQFSNKANCLVPSTSLPRNCYSPPFLLIQYSRKLLSNCFNIKKSRELLKNKTSTLFCRQNVLKSQIKMHSKIKQVWFYKYQVNEAIDNFMCLFNILNYSPLEDVRCGLSALNIKLTNLILQVG